MDVFPIGLVGGAIALLVFIIILSKCLFTIHTKQAAVIEKFGKFERIAGPGLNFKIPFIEKVVYVEDLNMHLRNAITAGNLAAMKSVEPPPSAKK